MAKKRRAEQSSVAVLWWMKSQDKSEDGGQTQQTIEKY